MEQYSKAKVEAITRSLPQSWHQFYIIMPANDSAGKAFHITSSDHPGSSVGKHNTPRSSWENNFQVIASQCHQFDPWSWHEHPPRRNQVAIIITML